MTRATVYLAGPIAGLNYDGATWWREYAASYLEDFDIKALSPMRAKQYLRDVETFSGNCGAESSMGPLSGARAVVARDRFDVERCNVLLVNLLGAERVSIGTMFEIAWAHQRHTPVVLVMEADGSNIHEHAFVTEAAGFRVATLDEGIAVVRAIVG
jgi:nucleoside 2-deoxyribosyltransferase